MFAWNGRLALLRPTMKPADWRGRARALRTVLQDSLRSARLAFVLLLLLLAMSLTACGTISVPPTTMPRNPEPPPSALPELPPSYLNSARAAISEWRKRLTEQIQKPAN